MVAGFVFGIAGCATTQVSTDYDPRVNFRAYRTFDVQQGQLFHEGVPDPGDTLVRDRVDAALSAELADKGLRRVEDNPDLVVRYRAQTHTRPVVMYTPDWPVGAFPEYGGWGWPAYYLDPYFYYPFGFEVWTDEVEAGSMTIEVIDADSNKLIYRAETEAEDKNFRSPDYIRKAVEKALAKYPERRPAATS